MSETPLIIQLLALSVNVAAKAGHIIRDVMNKGDLGIVEKGSNDFQTEADRLAQHCIVASLENKFPGITVIGEENVETLDENRMVFESDEFVLAEECPNQYINVRPEEIVVWIDPLDGTSDYMKGLFDRVTVLIGIAVNGNAIGGVIHQPYYNYNINKNTEGRTFWGLVGLGVRGITPVEAPTDKFVAVTGESEYRNVVKNAIDTLKPDDIVSFCGAGYIALILLEGKGHVVISSGYRCSKWDTCATEAILKTLGYHLTDVFGNCYNYSISTAHSIDKGVIVSIKNVDHKDLIEKVKSFFEQGFYT